MRIVRLWTDLVENHEKAYHEVPRGLKEQVKALLIAEGHGDLIDE